MSTPSPSTARLRLRGLLLLVGCLLPTIWFGIQQGQLRIDSANRSLKSRSTPAAEFTAAARREFGSDQALLLGFAAPADIAIEAQELEILGQLGRDLAAQCETVASVSPVTLADPGLAVLQVVLRDDCPADILTRNAARVVQQAQAARPPTLRLRATGQPLVEARIARAVDHERTRIVPAIALVLFVLLAWIYRSGWIAAIVLAPAGMTIAWLGGILFLFDHQLDPLLVLIDPLVLTVAVAASVHLVECYEQNRPVLGPPAAAQAARRKLWQPMLMATGTSMVGFFSLLISPIPAVGSFGVFAALGVALSTFLAFCTVPTWLAAVVPGAARQIATREPTFRYVAWLHASGLRLLLVLGIAAAALIVNSPNVRIDNDPLRILAADDQVRDSTDWLARRLGGVETVGVLIPKASPAAEPEVTALLLSDLLDREGVVGHAQPPRVAASGALLVSALLTPGGSTEREALFDSVEEFHRDLGCDDVHLVGPAVQVARDSGSLIRSQLQGLLLLVPLLGLSVAIGLRSWRLGLLSLIPNATPCLLLHGGMAALDRPLSVATVMIAAVMMGLIVDDTIHLLHHYRQSRRHGRSPQLAVADALRSSGRAITVTSVVLCAGLGVGVIGSLSSTVEFSVMAASTVAVAWVLDVVALPALLLVAGRTRRGMAWS